MIASLLLAVALLVSGDAFSCTSGSTTPKSYQFAPKGCLRTPTPTTTPTPIPVPTVGDVTFTGMPIPNIPTGPVGASGCEQPGNPPQPGVGGYAPCGSYKLNVGNCSVGMKPGNAIDFAFLYVLEDYTPTSIRIGNSLRVAIPRNAVMIFRFRTGAEVEFPVLPRSFGVAYSENTVRGPSAMKFMSLSEIKCDFDYSKVDYSGGYGKANGCYQTGVDSAIVGKITKTGNDPTVAFPYCQMKPNTTYYLSIRNEDPERNRGAISCDYGTCGVVLGFQ